jgi:hypothetical protein
VAVEAMSDDCQGWGIELAHRKWSWTTYNGRLYYLFCRDVGRHGMVKKENPKLETYNIKDTPVVTHGGSSRYEPRPTGDEAQMVTI